MVIRLDNQTAWPTTDSDAEPPGGPAHGRRRDGTGATHDPGAYLCRAA